MPADGKEYAVLPVGPDNDCGAAKVALIILDARQRPGEGPQVRCLARSVDIQLGQSTWQVCHTRDHSRAGGSERHLLGLSERGAGSEDNEKQRQRYYSKSQTSHRFYS